MTTELWMLVLSAGLQWLLIMTVATPLILTKGPTWGFGNRTEPVALDGWLGRTQRASANLQENLVLFAILVLAVHVTGSNDSTTALGAQLFFGARVAHALAYMAGVPVLRTLLWAVSIAGMVMIAAALF